LLKPIRAASALLCKVSHFVAKIDKIHRVPEPLNKKEIGGIHMEPVAIPIDGVLDLHTFNPREISSLLNDYISACRAEGVFHLRIIHGKGKGIQKARVHSILSRNTWVKSFADAPVDAGGWGATLVELAEG
jgi:DNA-nicking Smr family endonuclease